ncbi:MAG: carboxypeptidase-like regulatory domain-containing protein [Chitinophagaceae bacterium]|nr:carboxypeptidase-like regulatory domain-containing protein [Chitinophagaceae bacterium]MCW5929584.1 carboxypeptidase-like regulatory domain-containing protein [Chitinophagaceae bacterium]
MKKLCLLGMGMLWVTLVMAIPVTGVIKDIDGYILPYSSVVVKGSTTGVTANSDGIYYLNLPSGTYTLQCMHVGYATVEKEITVERNDIVVNFVLKRQQLTLKEVVISRGEDPAYEIIRQAIKKRKDYKNPVAAFSCEVYTKGQLTLRDYPQMIFGQRVDFGDGDSSKSTMLYLSETIATYSFQRPDKEKAVVTSTRVSGQGDGFGFSNPKYIDFYNNNVSIVEALNPRGFISPIADNALNFYRYRYMGSFTEDGRLINRIMVIPKRSYEPVFQGYINIIEDEWRIQSVDLLLTKASQMELADSVKIEQLYMPVSRDVWMIQSQVLYPTVKVFGFDAGGSFVSVYSKYNLQPGFDKRHFDNVVIRYNEGSNKMPRQYWDTVRPVPLLSEEILDYIQKDSLETVRRDPKYLDSLDRRRNRVTVPGLLAFGQTFVRQSRRSSFSYRPVFEIVNFNTAEGLNINFAPVYSRRFTDSKSISLAPTIRYGFSNHHLNADLSATYYFGKKVSRSITVEGGKRVSQFNSHSPILPVVNTYTTLIRGYNYMKIYEAWFTNLGYTYGVGEGLTIRGEISFQDRIPLENTNNAIWTSGKRLERRTPNYPTELLNENFTRHNAVTTGITLSYKPGTRYIQLPDRKINIGSKHPLFTLNYTKGLNGVFNSIADFDKWSFSVNGDLNLRLPGLFKYNIAVGGFLNNKNVPVQDYRHFNGNQTLIAGEYLNSFQLASYYARSNTEPFYTTLNAEHHFNGFLTNKIPWVKKLNVYLVGGANAFIVHKDNYYYELFFGLENIFKVIRVDYVFGYGNGFKNSAFRIGIRTFGN